MTYPVVKINNHGLNMLIAIGNHYKSDKFPYLVVEKQTTGEYNLWQVDNPNDWSEGNQYEILAHLPLNGSPYLDGLEVLPRLNQDDKVDKLAEERFPIKNEAALDIIECLQIKQEVYAEGYNKAREKYKFTEEDLKTACIMFARWIRGGTPSLRVAENPDERFKQIIESLMKPKLPIGFESVMEPKYLHIGAEKGVKGSGSRIKNKNGGKPKTFINSERRTEWVGKWVY